MTVRTQVVQYELGTQSNSLVWLSMYGKQRSKMIRSGSVQ
jgi:hypothetical protein